MASQSVEQFYFHNFHNFLPELHNNPDALLNQRHLYKYLFQYWTVYSWVLQGLQGCCICDLQNVLQ